MTGQTLGAPTPGKTAARVYQTAALNHTSSGNYQAITFDSEVFDYGGLHDPAVNPSRLTAPVAGIYVCKGLVGLSGNATGIREARLTRNGTEVLDAFGTDNAPGTNAWVRPVLAIAELAIGDYIEVVAFQNSGANLAYFVGTSGAVIGLSAVLVG